MNDVTTPAIHLGDLTSAYPSARRPTLAANVVSTSQPLAAQAGLQALAAGGNAFCTGGSVSQPSARSAAHCNTARPMLRKASTRNGVQLGMPRMLLPAGSMHSSGL